MGLSDNLRKLDAHSSVAKEFRVHTVQGAFVSVVTVICKCYYSPSWFFSNLGLEEDIIVT